MPRPVHRPSGGHLRLSGNGACRIATNPCRLMTEGRARKAHPIKNGVVELFSGAALRMALLRFLSSEIRLAPTRAFGGARDWVQKNATHTARSFWRSGDGTTDGPIPAPTRPTDDARQYARAGVRHLIAYCLNDSCRHQALIDVSSYPPDTPVPVRRQGRVRQVRGSRPAHRRATKLEGGAGLD